MNESPQNAWFYSHEGERIGPVTFADLRIKAKEGELNPRLDLVWKHGMDQWTAAGEIEGLFERRGAGINEDPAQPADPYLTPGEESAAAGIADQAEWRGARRRAFLFTIFVLPFLLNFGVATVTTTFEAQVGKEIAGFVLLGVMILTCIVVLHTSLQRLVNIGMSRWWYLGNFVPLLNLWVGYRCFACPAGYAYHKKLDGPGVLLAIIYWLMILAAVLAVAAAAALLLGAIGNPEIQEKIREAIHQTSARMQKK